MKKICFVTASPLTVNFFLLPHLVHLGTNYDLSLAVTHPGEVSLDLPSEVKLFPVEIHRKMAPWKDLLALARLVYILRFEKFDLVTDFE